eukprot:2577910-Pleurochrysis_carterae.AAC.1
MRNPAIAVAVAEDGALAVQVVLYGSDSHSHQLQLALHILPIRVHGTQSYPCSVAAHHMTDMS